MKSATHPSMAERFGQALGRTYNRLRRQEARFVDWMARKGVPVSIGKGLLWAVKLLVLAVLLYVAFWVALLLIFAVVAAWAAPHGVSDSKDEDWSFTTLEQLRKTPGYDPVPYNDFEHPDYPDDKSN